jgi:hypothetical protein
MKRHQAALVVVIALVVALGALTPAIGGLSSRSNPAKEARVAKKIASKALRKANQALRSAGKPGPAGAPGAPGAAGTALAYASVSKTAQVDTAASKGVAAGSVTNPQEGIYCFDLSFTPTNVVATLSDGTSGEVAALLGAAVGPACGSNDSAEVLTATSAGLGGAGSNRAFYVLFN